MAGKTRSYKRAQKKGRTQRRRGGSFIGRSLTNVSRLNINTIGAMTSKLNALLIANKVPYKFSDGTFANQYILTDQNYASDDNVGRGNTRPLSTGPMTGFSGVFGNSQ
jgi:hypothetical protein